MQRIAAAVGTDDARFAEVRKGLLEQLDDVLNAELVRTVPAPDGDGQSRERARAILAVITSVRWYAAGVRACLAEGAYASVLALTRAVTEAYAREGIIADTPPTAEGSAERRKRLKATTPTKTLKELLKNTDGELPKPLLSAMKKLIAEANRHTNDFVHCGPAEFDIHEKGMTNDHPPRYPAAKIAGAVSVVKLIVAGASALYFEATGKTDCEQFRTLEKEIRRMAKTPDDGDPIGSEPS